MLTDPTPTLTAFYKKTRPIFGNHQKSRIITNIDTADVDAIVSEVAALKERCEKAERENELQEQRICENCLHWNEDGHGTHVPYGHCQLLGTNPRNDWGCQGFEEMEIIECSCLEPEFGHAPGCRFYKPVKESEDGIGKA